MRLLTSDLLKEIAVTVNHRLYKAERAAFPPKKIAVHRRPFLGDFCLQSLDILMEHSLNLPLHTRLDAVVQGVEVWRLRRREVMKTSIFTENSKKYKFLGISLF